MRRTPLILVLALTTSGCYQYFPVHDNEPLPETDVEVRASLEEPQTLDLGTMTINDVSAVEGYVRRSNGDSLSLFSSQLRTFYGLRERTNGAVFDFDRTQFRLLEQRKLVPWKSAAAIGITTVGLAVAMYYAVDLGGGNGPGDSTNQPDLGRRANIPLLKLLVPLLFW